MQKTRTSVWRIGILKPFRQMWWDGSSPFCLIMRLLSSCLNCHIDQMSICRLINSTQKQYAGSNVTSGEEFWCILGNSLWIRTLVKNVNLICIRFKNFKRTIPQTCLLNCYIVLNPEYYQYILYSFYCCLIILHKTQNHANNVWKTLKSALTIVLF